MSEQELRYIATASGSDCKAASVARESGGWAGQSGQQVALSAGELAEELGVAVKHEPEEDQRHNRL